MRLFSSLTLIRNLTQESQPFESNISMWSLSCSILSPNALLFNDVSGITAELLRRKCSLESYPVVLQIFSEESKRIILMRVVSLCNRRLQCLDVSRRGHHSRSLFGRSEEKMTEE